MASSTLRSSDVICFRLLASREQRGEVGRVGAARWGLVRPGLPDDHCRIAAQGSSYRICRASKLAQSDIQSDQGNTIPSVQVVIAVKIGLHGREQQSQNQRGQGDHHENDESDGFGAIVALVMLFQSTLNKQPRAARQNQQYHQAERCDDSRNADYPPEESAHFAAAITLSVSAGDMTSSA
jgi:hypothetical protein